MYRSSVLFIFFNYIYILYIEISSIYIKVLLNPKKQLASFENNILIAFL